MKVTADNYSDFKSRIKANRRIIFHEPVNCAKKERNNNNNNNHLFIVEWQIPGIETEENISLITAAAGLKQGVHDYSFSTINEQNHNRLSTQNRCHNNKPAPQDM